jgi:hypothetical protein
LVIATQGGAGRGRGHGVHPGCVDEALSDDLCVAAEAALLQRALAIDHSLEQVVGEPETAAPVEHRPEDIERQEERPV